MIFCLSYLLQKPKAPETFVEAALKGRRDALRDPAARCAMGLPIQSGTGGQFTLLPNPRMVRRGVPQAFLAERRLPEPINLCDDSARDGAGWSPLSGNEPAGDGWRDHAEQASDSRV
jgi:hypothetical protein